jgi:hypothetical protein
MIPLKVPWKVTSEPKSQLFSAVICSLAHPLPFVLSSFTLPTLHFCLVELPPKQTTCRPAFFTGSLLENPAWLPLVLPSGLWGCSWAEGTYFSGQALKLSFVLPTATPSTLYFFFLSEASRKNWRWTHCAPRELCAVFLPLTIPWQNCQECDTSSMFWWANWHFEKL